MEFTEFFLLRDPGKISLVERAEPTHEQPLVH